MSVVFCYLPHLLFAKESSLYPILFHGNFIVFKICFKSNFVLLEDQRGKKSNDGDIAMSSNVKEFSCHLVLSAAAMFPTLMDISINLLVVYRESVNLIGYITRRLSADSLQL